MIKSNKRIFKLIVISTIILACLVPQVSAKKGVTYVMEKKDDELTKEEREAYKKIKKVMDEAIGYYNKYTTYEKLIVISYRPTVEGAAALVNGNGIVFGPNCIKVSTALHEIAHTAGIGSEKFEKLFKYLPVPLKGHEGEFYYEYTGKHGNEMVKKLKEEFSLYSQDYISFYDGTDVGFSPYGLPTCVRDNPKEIYSKNELIAHCKMVEAIRKDMATLK